MLVSTIRSWLKRSERKRTAAKPRPVRLQLEELEARDCPAVFNIGAGDVSALIAAINTANTNNQPDTINLAAGSTYTLTAVNNVGLGAGGLPVVALDTSAANVLTVNGNGAIVERSTVGGTPNFRIFQVLGVLNLDSVTVRNGNTNDGNFGAGIDVGSGGSLVLTNSAVINNVNQAQPGGGIGIEPGAGNVTIINSTISGNSTQSLGGGGVGNGGGIETFNAGTLLISNSTIANNTSAESGGGLRAAGTSTVVLQNTIISGNTDASGANDVSNGATVSAMNSIVPTSSGIGIGGTFSTANPILGTLKNNGGLTPTHAILAGSPAIDAGDNTGVPANDQRGTGFNRVINGTVDIGAYEYQPPAVRVTLTSSGNPSQLGQAVTFTASIAGVASNSNIPEGTATLYVDGAPAAAVAASNGTASFTLASLSTGAHTLVVVFNPTITGDYTFSAGVSNAFTQLVNAPSTATPISRRWRR